MEITAVPGHKLGDATLATRAVNLLTKHYPGFEWQVRINDENYYGLMEVINLTLNDSLWANCPYGYVLHLYTVYQDPGLKCVIMAGGEILERANIYRGANKGDAPIMIDGVLQKHQPTRIIH